MENITKVLIKEEVSPEETPEVVEGTTPEEPNQEEPVVKEPEVKDTPDVDELIRQKLGMSAEDIAELKKSYDSLKDRVYLDDPELLPDDEFLKDFIATYKRGGDVLKYLEAKKTDFSAKSDEEIVKYELRRKNPGLSEKFLDRKYNDFLKKEFGIQDEYENEEDGQYAQELLRIYANEKRKEFSDELKKFQVPERKAIEQPSVDDNAIKEFQEFINSNPVTKGLSESKKVIFDDFNYVVDPDSIKAAAMDTNEFYKHFATEKGIDLDKFYKVVAIAQDPDAFLKARDAHVIAKAKIEWLKEMKNPSVDPKPQGKTGEVKIRVV